MARPLRRLLRPRRRARRIVPTDEPRAQRLGALLWAGFETSALADLGKLRDDAAAPAVERAGAAYPLACWLLAQGRPQAAAKEVNALRALGRGHDLVLEHLAVDVDVLVALGKSRVAARRLHDGLRSCPADSNLQLRRANVDPSTWLDAMNAVLDREGLAPVRFVDPARGVALDNIGALTSEETEGPLITVVMPAYDAAATIEWALSSVLAQTWTNLEVCVVDDASHDGTADLVLEIARHDPRVKLLRHHENRGCHAARNTGLAAARGAFVTVHDADDWSHPQKLALQAADLVEHPERWANYTYLVSVDDHLRLHHNGRHPYRLVRKNTSSLLVRREAFAIVGPWDEDRVSADTEFLMRLQARFGSTAVAPLAPHTPLSLARRSASSLTGDSPVGLRSLWHVQGVRRQYHEAFTAWHRSPRFTRDLPLQPGRVPRPFAHPRLAARGIVDADEHLDVVVLADFALDPPAPAPGEIASLVAAGHRVGLLHHPVYELGADRPIDDAVLAMAASGNPRFLSAGERVSCRLLVVRCPPCLEHRIEHLVEVEAEVTTEVGGPADWPAALSLLT